jgi:hypothetical protein
MARVKMHNLGGGHPRNVPRPQDPRPQDPRPQALSSAEAVGQAIDASIESEPLASAEDLHEDKEAEAQASAEDVPKDTGSEAKKRKTANESKAAEPQTAEHKKAKADKENEVKEPLSPTEDDDVRPVSPTKDGKQAKDEAELSNNKDPHELNDHKTNNKLPAGLEASQQTLSQKIASNDEFDDSSSDSGDEK